MKPFEATQYRHASVPAMTFGHLTHTLSPSTVWDVRVGRFVYNREDDPSTGNVMTIGRLDRITGVFSGAPQTFGGLTLIRTTSKATLNHYQPGLLGAITSGESAGRLKRRASPVDNHSRRVQVTSITLVGCFKGYRAIPRSPEVCSLPPPALSAMRSRSAIR